MPTQVRLRNVAKVKADMHGEMEAIMNAGTAAMMAATWACRCYFLKVLMYNMFMLHK